MRSLADLPEDVLRIIVLEIYNPFKVDVWFHYSGDGPFGNIPHSTSSETGKTLSALSRTCKALADIARPILFSTARFSRMPYVRQAIDSPWISHLTHVVIEFGNLSQEPEFSSRHSRNWFENRMPWVADLIKRLLARSSARHVYIAVKSEHGEVIRSLVSESSEELEGQSSPQTWNHRLESFGFNVGFHRGRQTVIEDFQTLIATFPNLTFLSARLDYPLSTPEACQFLDSIKSDFLTALLINIYNDNQAADFIRALHRWKSTLKYLSMIHENHKLQTESIWPLFGAFTKLKILSVLLCDETYDNDEFDQILLGIWNDNPSLIMGMAGARPFWRNEDGSRVMLRVPQERDQYGRQQNLDFWMRQHWAGDVPYQPCPGPPCEHIVQLSLEQEGDYEILKIK